MKIGWYGITVSLVCVGASVFAATTQYKFSEAGNYPGAFMTLPLAVEGRYIAGYYESGNVVSGYTQTGMNFRQINPPGALTSYVGAINRKGLLVGGGCSFYCNPYTGQYAFVFDHGAYSRISYPGGGTSPGTTAFGINDQGQIVGGFCPGHQTCPSEGGGITPANHGFLDDHGVFTQLDYPGAQYTEANGINDAGAIAGVYLVTSTGIHSFLYQNGLYTNIDMPGENWTIVSAINNLGVAAGVYQDRNLYVHGFLYQNGTFTTIDVPGATVSGIGGLDDAGVIVGAWSNAHRQGNFKGIPTSSLP